MAYVATLLSLIVNSRDFVAPISIAILRLIIQSFQLYKQKLVDNHKGFILYHAITGGSPRVDFSGTKFIMGLLLFIIITKSHYEQRWQ